MRISVKCPKQNFVGANQMADIIIKKSSEYHPRTTSKEQGRNLNLELYVSKLVICRYNFFFMYTLHTEGTCFHKWIGDNADTAEETKEGTGNYKQWSLPMGFWTVCGKCLAMRLSLCPSTTQGAVSGGWAAHLRHSSEPPEISF